MRKRVKRLNLNTTKRSHDKSLIKNLFTSLVTYGTVTTTETKARALKSYVQSKYAEFEAITESRLKKRWMNEEVSTSKFQDRIEKKLDSLKSNFKVTMVRVAPRKGDNADQFEVSIINFDDKSNEQHDVAKS